MKAKDALDLLTDKLLAYGPSKKAATKKPKQRAKKKSAKGIPTKGGT